MSKLKSLLICGLPFVLFACTQESKIKSATEEGVRAKIEAGLREESAPLLPERKILQSIYVHTFLKKTEVEIENVDISGDSAVVTVTVKTIADPIRRSLREVILKLDPSRQDAFNVSDALGLVAGQMKLDQTIVSKKSTVHLRKGDEWKVVEP